MALPSPQRTGIQCVTLHAGGVLPAHNNTAAGTICLAQAGSSTFLHLSSASAWLPQPTCPTRTSPMLYRYVGVLLELWPNTILRTALKALQRPGTAWNTQRHLICLLARFRASRCTSSMTRPPLRSSSGLGLSVRVGRGTLRPTAVALKVGWGREVGESGVRV